MLSDDLYQRAHQWAAITRQDVSQTLVGALDIVLTPIATAPELEKPVSALSDDEILALTRVQMAPVQGKRLEKLLQKQQQTILSMDERSELIVLIQIYHQLWIRQSEALAEAVRRGLRGPLEP